MSVFFYAFSLFVSCTYNDDLIDGSTDEEFIMRPDDIANYQSWTVMGTKERPDLGEFRTIYINKASEADRVEGAYPTGTIIVKEGRDFDNRNRVVMLQVMAKRNGGFNPSGNGWEWAMTLSGQVAAIDDHRGDNSLLMLGGGGTCISCHSGANDLVIRDY